MVLSVQFKGTWFLCILGVFYFILAVGYYSSPFRKLYEEAEDSFFFFFFFNFVR